MFWEGGAILRQISLHSPGRPCIHYLAQAGLEFAVLVPLSLRCRDCWCAPSYGILCDDRWPVFQWTSHPAPGRGQLTSFCRLESCEERLSILMRLSISSSLALLTVEVFISEDSLAFSSCKSRKPSVLINKWGSRTHQGTSNLSPDGNWLTKQENRDWSADAITRQLSFLTCF